MMSDYSSLLNLRKDYTKLQIFSRFVVYFVIGILLVLFTKALLNMFGVHAINSAYDKENLNTQFFIFMVLIAPVTEELALRLFLIPKKINVIISLSVLFFLISNMVLNLFSQPNIIYRLVLAVLCIGASFVTWKRFVEFIDSNYNRFFHFSALLFGFVHLFNYDSVNDIWYYAPLIVLPHIVFGYFAGFIRLKMGFKYSVAFHIFNNSIVALMLLLVLKGGLV